DRAHRSREVMGSRGPRGGVPCSGKRGCSVESRVQCDGEWDRVPWVGRLASRARRGLAAALVAAGASALGSFAAAPARADTCSDCREPSIEEVAEVSSTGLEDVAFGNVRLYWDGGECRYTAMMPSRKMNG